MHIWSELGPEGARHAAARGDVVILVDALRSSVTITAALAAGARRVIPVESVEEARSYLGRPGFLVAGERGGEQVPDFDYGNSPTQLLRDADRLCGQTLILTTSNGTPLIRLCNAGAFRLLAGSLPNAGAAARAAFQLAKQSGRDIALLAAGGGGRPAVEDDYAVGVMAAGIRGQFESPGAEPVGTAADEPAERVFAGGPNGRRLARLGYAEDVALCARLNVFDQVGVSIDEAFVLWKAEPGGSWNNI